MLVYTISVCSLCRCFMENQVLAEFVRVLKISTNSRIEATLLQYLSIMIQNLESEHAICMLFWISQIFNLAPFSLWKMKNFVSYWVILTALLMDTMLYFADYCFSNDYINSIIVHQFDFNRGDLAQYYVSFLRLCHLSVSVSHWHS